MQDYDTLLKKLCKLYLEAGWVLVPIARGEKKPTTKAWNELRNCVSNLKDLPKITGNVGLAHAFSRTCTFDLDDLAKAIKQLHGKIDVKALLATKGMVKINSGRKNRAKLLFAIPKNVVHLGTVNRVAEEGWELRCSSNDGTTTVQDVLPPSIHPVTKKPYTWEGDWERGLPYLPDALLDMWRAYLAPRTANKRKPGDIPVSIIQSALSAMDPDMDYGQWLSIGMALHSEGDDALLDLWDEWSSGASKYDIGGCEGRWNGFRGAGVTMGTFWHIAKESGWSSEGVLDGMLDGDVEPKTVARYAATMGLDKFAMDALAHKISKKSDGVSKRAVIDFMRAEARQDSDLTHDEMARRFLVHLDSTHPDNARTVSTEGKFWRPKNGLYKPLELATASTLLPVLFPEQKLCKREGDYKSIARHALNVVAEDDFFMGAPVGVAVGDKFLSLDAVTAELKTEDLGPEHRQRIALSAAPDPQCPTPLWDAFIQQTFWDHEADTLNTQSALVPEMLGAVLFRLSVPMKKAVLMYGPTDTGKSQLLKIVEGMISPEFVSAVDPKDLDNDYKRALLAGKLLNAVGEIDDRAPLASNSFKMMTGGDLITGRQIYGRAFSFHFHGTFVSNSNFFPATRDRSDAFFGRWLILHFPNQVSKNDQQRGLAEAILADELPGILYQAVSGAQKVIRQNYEYTKTGAHKRMLLVWQRNANSVLSWLHNEEWVERIEDKENPVGTTLAYEHYAAWCAMNQRRPVNMDQFGHELERNGMRQQSKPWGWVGLRLRAPQTRH